MIKHPRETYHTPFNVLNDDELSTSQKLEILQYWKEDIELRLLAEAEGMGRYNPISAEKESRLADEERAVGKAIGILNSAE